MPTPYRASVTATALTMALLACAGAVAQATVTWTGNGDWFTDAGNWDPSPPDAGAQVVVTSGNLLISNSPPPLAAFRLDSGTVTLTHWATRLEAVEVYLNGGTLTHAGNMGVTHAGGVWIPVARVHIVCSNLMLGASATINASERGYKGARYGDGERTGRGPGGSYGATGASHGGLGAQVTWGTTGVIYGDAQTPDQPGSGAGAHSNHENDAGGHGGGYVRIDATGHVIVDGTISANGGQGVLRPAGGSGGAILIHCRTLAGAGTVSAQGGAGVSGAYPNAGGGGRIAVHYDPAAQAALAVPALTVTTFSYSANGEAWDGDMGTLWFTDNRFLVSPLRMAGQWSGPDTSPVTLDHFEIPTNRQIRFVASGARLTVTNHLAINGSRARLCMGGNGYYHRGALNVYNTAAVGPTLTVGGDLEIIGGGRLNIRAGGSHAAGDDWGAVMTVGGRLLIGAGSVLTSRSHITAGNSVRIRAAALTIDAGETTTSAGLGYRGGIHSTLFPGGAAAGLGPGGGAGGEPGGGGGYGGRGGGTSAAYGWVDVPAHPGSGGGTMLYDANDRGGSGGGLVWLDIAGTATINGAITATAGGAAGRSSGGSGGGLLLHCDTLNASNATLAASGTGSTDTRVCGGGGGRIALLYRSGDLPASVALDNPAGSGTRPGHQGTWFTARLPAMGTPLDTTDGTPALQSQTDPLTVADGLRVIRTIDRWDNAFLRWTDHCTHLDSNPVAVTMTYTVSGLEPHGIARAFTNSVPVKTVTTADAQGTVTISEITVTPSVAIIVQISPSGSLFLIR